MSDIIKYQAIKYIKPASGFKLQKNLSYRIPQDVADDEIVFKIAYSTLNPVDLIFHNTSTLTNPLGKERGIGREFAGKVVAFGKDVTGLTIGDRVTAFTVNFPSYEGPVAEYIKVKKEYFQVAKVPEGLSLKDASSFPLSYLTAYKLVYGYYNITPESKVLVLGGGTMAGFFTLQILKNVLKVHDVISVQSSKSDSLYENKFGFKVNSVNYDKVSSPPAQVSEIIANSFRGEKFDVIIDTIGDHDFIDNIGKYLKHSSDSYYLTIVGDNVPRYNTTLSSFFFTIYGVASRVFKNAFFQKGFTYRFVALSENQEAFDEAVAYLADGTINTLIDSAYPITEFDNAVAKLGTHKAKGKILIELENESAVDNPMIL